MPDADVKEDKDGYTLQMDLPGRTQNDVALELEHGTLTVSSVKKKKNMIPRMIKTKADG